MPAPFRKQNIQNTPLKIVGGNKFGRYPKISQEQTWNMIVSDNALVPYAGYKARQLLGSGITGRGIYASKIQNFILAVAGTKVMRITNPGTLGTQVGTLDTNNGEVFMTENNGGQILITDGRYAYIYDYGDGGVFYSSKVGSANYFAFGDPDLFLDTGYCSFQDGRFIVAVNGTQNWVLSNLNDGLVWPSTARNVGAIQSKPGFVQAAIPVPGGGNNLLVMGTDVAESWQNVGAALFTYQRNSTFNIDYGCINAASIAFLDNYIVWVAVNEQSGPIIMYTQGTGIKSISTDGIDFKLADLTAPENCTGFLFRQDGHIIYQITFYTDNLTYAYDFNTGLFFTISDENLNYHPARQVVFFNNEYYFVSLKDGVLYQFGSQFTDIIDIEGNQKIIPRLRVVPPLRLVSQRYFIAKSLGFTIENGRPNRATEHPGFITAPQLLTAETGFILTTESGKAIKTDQKSYEAVSYTTYENVVDLSISRDGGESFGNAVRIPMNPTGKRKSRMIFQRLGIVNDVTFQLRFSGTDRFVCFDGEVEVYQ